MVGVDDRVARAPRDRAVLRRDRAFEQARRGGTFGELHRLALARVGVGDGHIQRSVADQIIILNGQNCRRTDGRHVNGRRAVGTTGQRIACGDGTGRAIGLERVVDRDRQRIARDRVDRSIGGRAIPRSAIGGSERCFEHPAPHGIERDRLTVARTVGNGHNERRGG